MTAATRIEWTGNIQVHQPLTAHELRAIAEDARQRTLLFAGLTEQSKLTGLTVRP